VSVNEGENLLQMLVVSSVDLLAQLLPCERCLGFAGCGVAEMHQRSDDALEALPKPAATLASAAMACCSSTERLAGFLRRLQRNIQSGVATAISGASSFSVPLALIFVMTPISWIGVGRFSLHRHSNGLLRRWGLELL
jgi:hypothetical protein